LPDRPQGHSRVRYLCQTETPSRSATHRHQAKMMISKRPSAMRADRPHRGIKCPGYRAAPDKSGLESAFHPHLLSRKVLVRAIHRPPLCSPATSSPGGSRKRNIALNLMRMGPRPAFLKHRRCLLLSTRIAVPPRACMTLWVSGYLREFLNAPYAIHIPRTAKTATTTKQSHKDKTSPPASAAPSFNIICRTPSIT